MCYNDQFYNILVNLEVIVTRVLPKYTELKCKFDSIDNFIFKNYGSINHQEI